MRKKKLRKDENFYLRQRIRKLKERIKLRTEDMKLTVEEQIQEQNKKYSDLLSAIVRLRTEWETTYTHTSFKELFSKPYIAQKIVEESKEEKMERFNSKKNPYLDQK